MIAAVPAVAQPTVAGVVNAASFAKQALPNSGIAQGSIFSIFGTALGPSAAVKASSFPLPTKLGGTSVSVTVNGTTVDAIIFFTVAGQVNALMPSKTPVGNGTLTVTYNGQTSAPAPVSVVPSTFGIFSINSSGSGPGVFTDGANQVNSFTLAANPGEILNIWGTGLGAISGDDAMPPTTGNITANSPSVYVGGVQVTPTYHGRSGCCSGVDQIQIQIPQNVTGCGVPVAVQIGDTVSNFVTISTAETGKVCSDTTTGLSGSLFSQFVTSGSASLGFVNLLRTVSTTTLPPPLGTGMPTTSTTDLGTAAFQKDIFASLGISGLPFQYTNFGACTVFNFSGQSAKVTGSFQQTGLDAGSVVTVAGPNGTQQLAPIPTVVGDYFATLGGTSTGEGPLYLSPGSYTVSASGGKDVGPFSVTFPVPQTLTWTNEDSIDTIARASGLNITWSGADPNSFVLIEGSSLTGTDLADILGGGFVCVAKASDGHLSVPSVVTLALPPSSVIDLGGVSFPTATLSVGSFALPVKFSATGLDYAFAESSVLISKSVTFQ
jgi:uncharacterized protein (TIGR03437 family)